MNWLPPPPPGIYHNVPEPTYRAWSACNNSALDYIAGASPFHARFYLDNPEPKTPALIEGDALHTLLLARGDFMKRFAIVPECDKRTKEGKAIYAAFQKTQRGRQELREDRAAAVDGWSQMALEHPIFEGLADMQGDDGNEVSMVWIDPDHGITCKARMDMYRPSISTIGDIKTTESAAPEAFSKSIASYGYHRQAEWYIRGCSILGVKIEAFVFIALEKAPPYAVAAYRISGDNLGLAFDENQKLLAKWAECVKSGKWPSYPQEITEINLPHWVFTKALREWKGAI